MMKMCAFVALGVVAGGVQGQVIEVVGVSPPARVVGAPVGTAIIHVNRLNALDPLHGRLHGQRTKGAGHLVDVERRCPHGG
jgi:hypothetical protein